LVKICPTFYENEVILEVFNHQMWGEEISKSHQISVFGLECGSQRK
jgi:hypothetical protein